MVVTRAWVGVREQVGRKWKERLSLRKLCNKRSRKKGGRGSKD